MTSGVGENLAVRLHTLGMPPSTERLSIAAPKLSEARVKMISAAINPLDRYIAAGKIADQGPLPRTLGVEGVGEFEGNLVILSGCGLGMSRDGTWSKYVNVPKDCLVRVPVGIDPDQAAAMGVAGVTALRVVYDLGQVNDNDIVLVLGATGGVGSCVVSLAHARGAKVIAQTRSSSKSTFLSSLGADPIVANSPTELFNIAKELKPSVVIDPLGGEWTGVGVQLLSPGGKIVIYGTSSNPKGEIPLQDLYRKGANILGYGGINEPPQRIRDGIVDALAELGAGRMKVHISKKYSLEDFTLALEDLSHNTNPGKIILDIAKS